MDLPFLQPMDIDPSGPSGQARRVSFLSSSEINIQKKKEKRKTISKNYNNKIVAAIPCSL